MRIIKKLNPKTRAVEEVIYMTNKEYKLYKKYGLPKKFVFCRKCAKYSPESNPVCLMWSKLSPYMTEKQLAEFRRILELVKKNDEPTICDFYKEVNE